MFLNFFSIFFFLLLRGDGQLRAHQSETKEIKEEEDMDVEDDNNSDSGLPRPLRDLHDEARLQETGDELWRVKGKSKISSDSGSGDETDRNATDRKGSVLSTGKNGIQKTIEKLVIVEKSDMSLLTDRMGHIILALKTAFESKKTESGFVSRKDATALYLDMGFRGSDLAELVAYLEGQHVSLLDWSKFLSVYGIFSGLSVDKRTHERIWIPNELSKWREVDQSILEIVLRAAQPFSSAAIIGDAPRSEVEVHK